MDELRKILVDYLKDNLDTTCDWYHWEINEEFLPTGITLPKGNRIAKNLSLKEQLNCRWKEAKKQDIKGSLIEYYIKKWGGIKSNSKEKLNLYKTESAENLINLGVNGVASWSKALVIHDCNCYAIFDARVSCALNYLQILHKVEDKSLFPILASRNSQIKKANQNLKQNSKNWKKLKNDEFYNEYLNLLYDISRELKISISIIEMLLFSKAIEIYENATF
jgi:hypothetical protein